MWLLEGGGRVLLKVRCLLAFVVWGVCALACLCVWSNMVCPHTHKELMCFQYKSQRRQLIKSVAAWVEGGALEVGGLEDHQRWVLAFKGILFIVIPASCSLLCDL